MIEIIESIKKVVEAEIRKIHILELAIVTSVFPHSEDDDKDNYECNVKLRDKDLELRKVPVSTSHIGLAHCPHVGDLVLLSFINGDINSPIITGRLYNDEDRPPNSKSEEIIYQPDYSTNNSLRRIEVRLPGDDVVLSVFDDRVKFLAGKSSFLEKASGEISLRSDKDQEKQEGSFVDVDNDQIILTCKDSSQECAITLLNSGDIRVKTTKNIELVSEGDMNVHCKGSFSLNADGDITMRSKKDMELGSASTASLESVGETILRSDSVFKIVASTLNMSGSAAVSLRAPMININ